MRSHITLQLLSQGGGWLKAPSSSAWAHFGFRSWDRQCSCEILGLHSSRQFRPPLLLTVIPRFLDVSVFLPVGFTALQNPFIMNWLRRNPAWSWTHPQPHKYRETWPARAAHTHVESVHFPATNQRSTRRRASQSKQTHTARANFCCLLSEALGWVPRTRQEGSARLP